MLKLIHHSGQNSILKKVNNEIITEFKMFKDWGTKGTYVLKYKNPFIIKYIVTKDEIISNVKENGVSQGIFNIDLLYNINISKYLNSIILYKKDKAAEKTTYDIKKETDKQSWDAEYNKHFNKLDHEYFVEWLNDNYDTNRNDFISTVDISSIDKKQIDNLLNDLISDFNKNNLEDFITKDDIKQPKRVTSIRATYYDTKEEMFYIEVKILGEPSDITIKGIKDFIEGQCSDGWGEGYSQKEQNNYFIDTWIYGGKEKGINIEYIGYDNE